MLSKAEAGIVSHNGDTVGLFRHVESISRYLSNAATSASSARLTAIQKSRSRAVKRSPILSRAGRCDCGPDHNGTVVTLEMIGE